MSETNVISVKMAESYVGRAPLVLEAAGVGSCVAICLYDPKLKVGGLAHAMLPSLSDWGKSNPPDNLLCFADCAIDWLVGELKKFGAVSAGLEAKVVGGADMFEEAGEDNTGSIGDKTVEVVKVKLKSLGIKLKSADVGENVGRSVRFDLSTGIVTVSTRM